MFKLFKLVNCNENLYSGLISVWSMCVAFGIASSITHGNPAIFVALVGIVFPVLIFIIDRIIESCSNFITHGEHRIENFILGRILKDRNLDAFEFVTGIQLIFALPIMVMCYIIYHPLLLWLAIPAALMAGILFLARYGYGIMIKLRGHVNDPNAHRK